MEDETAGDAQDASAVSRHSIASQTDFGADVSVTDCHGDFGEDLSSDNEMVE